MKIVLLAAYEMGRQPFGLAMPAAILRREGHQVHCADLALDRLPAQAIGEAGLVAFHLPMHTATRLAAPVIRTVGAINATAHVSAYGLYAPLNETLLRSLGVSSIFGGEFEPLLAALARRLDRGETVVQAGAEVSFDRVDFAVPDRTGLPGLDRYARLLGIGTPRIAGYTEASRGCKHRCRHCPVVPVYEGAFRIVPVDVVLADVRNQVQAGARHITFGDPDFFNGPAHAARIVESLHREFPDLSYDATIKIEHLLARRDLLPVLRETGCVFVTSAVESIDDGVLRKLEKGHTRADFVDAVAECRRAGLPLSPTFIPFTPWTTWSGYRELLDVLVDLDLVENTAPVQLTLRLLIPAGSRLLELLEIRDVVGAFDNALLTYPWCHDDPVLDALPARLMRIVDGAQRMGAPRAALFQLIRDAAHDGAAPELVLPARATIPYLNEPWYC